MQRCLETLPGDRIDGSRIVDNVTLDLEGRRKRRQTLTCAGGTSLLVDLPAVPSLKDGDGLLLENGDIVKVNAMAEPLIEVRPPAAESARIAWHLGNRHLPVQFVGDSIRLRADHVIEAMLEQLGVTVRHVESPFDPEGGAYGHRHTRGHSHD